MFDPFVAGYVNASHSLTQTLLDQIEKEKMYARFFEGKKDLVFLDIGANIGLVSIYASPACSRVVAVEPAPDAYRVLQGMTLPFQNIHLANYALAPTDALVDFYLNDINSTASSTVNTYGKKIAVQGMTLKTILQSHQLEHVDVCKCDAEGGEGESLNIDELRFAFPIVDSWYIETHNCPHTSWEHKLEVLAGRLMRLGYPKLTIKGMAIIARK